MVLRLLARMALGRWRLWWGWCPSCSSLGPQVDRCPVCRSGRAHRWSRAAEKLVWQRFVNRGCQ